MKKIIDPPGTTPDAAGVKVPEGWALTPIEPTPEMLEAAWDATNADHLMGDIDGMNTAAYLAMIEAAPPAPTGDA